MMRSTGIVFTSVLLLFGTLAEVRGKRILAVEFVGTKSHVFTYLPLLEELGRLGHEVTLLSPLEPTSKGGVRRIFSVDPDVFMKSFNISIYEMKENDEDVSNPFEILTVVTPKLCGELYDRKDVQALMEEPFDLVIIQPLFNDCALGLVHKVMTKNKAPLILFTPTSAPSFVVSRTGGHHPPSFVPSIFTGFPSEMTFWQRMKNIGTEVLVSFGYSVYYLPVVEAVYREKIGADTPSVNEILGSASLILANAHFSTSQPKPNLPDVVDVGGLHSRPAKPLSKDFEDFIQKGGENGFILMSFGTGLRGDEMPEHKRQIFLNVFSKLKQQIIWKNEADKVPNLPKNVMFSKWIPQQDLLGHPKIQMFITHCGLGGIEESIYHGVPLLGIPFFGDQPMNAKEAGNRGFLVELEWKSLSEEKLLVGINEVLKNPRYRESVKNISSVFRDQIDSPLSRAVWWTEYVMRHKGAPALQSVARKLNFVQYHSLDVIGAWLAIGATILLLLGTSILFLIRKLMSFFISTHNQNAKKNQ